MTEQVKMEENVMLVDASFLNKVIEDLKKYFELRLGRKLTEINPADLFVFFACDAGIQPGNNRIQVLFIYDDDSCRLKHAHPADLKKELNDVAFSDNMGEFSFFTYHPGNVAAIDELYLESLKVLVEAKEIKKIIVIAFDELYEEKMTDILEKANEKEIIRFSMNNSNAQTFCRWEMLVYPIMKALGIRGDEL